MEKFFEEAVQTLEIIVEALHPRPSFDKRSIYQPQNNKRSTVNHHRHHKPIYHRKASQRSH